MAVLARLENVSKEYGTGVKTIALRPTTRLPLRLALRDVLGRPARSLGTSLGVAAAFVLVLARGSMLDSMRTTFGVLFHGARR